MATVVDILQETKNEASKTTSAKLHFEIEKHILTRHFNEIYSQLFNLQKKVEELEVENEELRRTLNREIEELTNEVRGEKQGWRES